MLARRSYSSHGAPATFSKELVKNSFSGRAVGWQSAYADPEARTLEAKNLLSRRRIALQMLESLPLSAKILDAGCGSGEIAAKLIERGYEVWGVDIAEPMVARAAARFGSDRFRVADIEHMPFATNTFDAVICLGVIEYLASDEAALREIARVLKPGGIALLATPSAISPMKHLDSAFLQLMPLLMPAYQTVKHGLRQRKPPASSPRPSARLPGRTYRLERWLPLLQAHGFECEEFISHGWGWYRSPLGKLMQSVANRSEPLLRFSEPVIPTVLVNWLATEQIVRVHLAKEI
jgi:SAM-dependent methyltransferase